MNNQNNKRGRAMASYAHKLNFIDQEQLHYDEEEQLFFDIEDRVEKSMSRLYKGRERRSRMLLDDYLEQREMQKHHRDLYDPDLDD